VKRPAVITPEAQDDLRNLFDYIADRSSSNSCAALSWAH
jgi:plasmid stabilization system protein ParE